MGKILKPFPIPRSVLKQKLLTYLQEDLQNGDLASGFIKEEATATATIWSKSPGIVAGLEEAILLFEDSELTVEKFVNDGDSFNSNEKIITIKGNLRSILMIERTALNLLMKLSSIACSTADYVKQIHKVSETVKLAATRKVTPGFGWFEKKAVVYGGGDPHRWNLGDMIMFKDTHRAAFKDNLADLLKTARLNVSFSKKIELEIEDPNDLPIAIENQVDIIMFDNMNPGQIKSTIQSLETHPNNIIFEASGNITIENIHDYAASGIDVISTSAPIFRPHKSVDYSLKIDTINTK